MTDAVLGIDVSKNTFDTNLRAGTKARSKSFEPLTSALLPRTAVTRNGG
jgi:hypothetical protein